MANKEKIKDQLNRLSAEFYYILGYDRRGTNFDFSISCHPQEIACYRMAEIAYEEFMGDRLDCMEDEE